MKSLLVFWRTCFFLALTILPLQAQAFGQSAPEQAKQTLETAVSRILADIRNPDYLNPATRGPLRTRIEDEVYHIFDFDEFSSRTVGQRWRTFSPEEKKDFSAAFADLLFNTYLNRVTGYNGEEVDYTGVVASPDGKLVEVRTDISGRDRKRIPVFYRMLLKNGNWRVYDVIIENISLVRNYRTQFQDILNTASPEQLIARIRERAKQVAEEGASGGKGAN